MRGTSRSARKTSRSFAERIEPSSCRGRLDALDWICRSGILSLRAFVREIKMKAGIHPEYVSCKVYCACTPGKPVTEIVSTTPELHLDICSNCHPFYTGKQKLVDAAGRVEKFMRRYGKEATK